MVEDGPLGGLPQVKAVLFKVIFELWYAKALIFEFLLFDLWLVWGLFLGLDSLLVEQDMLGGLVFGLGNSD